MNSQSLNTTTFIQQASSTSVLSSWKTLQKKYLEYISLLKCKLAKAEETLIKQQLQKQQLKAQTQNIRSERDAQLKAKTESLLQLETVLQDYEKHIKKLQREISVWRHQVKSLQQTGSSALSTIKYDFKENTASQELRQSKTERFFKPKSIIQNQPTKASYEETQPKPSSIVPNRQKQAFDLFLILQRKDRLIEQLKQRHLHFRQVVLKFINSLNLKQNIYTLSQSYQISLNVSLEQREPKNYRKHLIVVNTGKIRVIQES